MSKETKSKMFDPFFTSKFIGRGLGLAATLGIIRAHNGAVDVRTKEGEGTTIQVLFPPSRESVQDAIKEWERMKKWRGSGTVLIVDDEEAVRHAAQQMMAALGFEVLLASDGQECVEIFKQNADRLDAVLLDITMPHESGDAAWREMQSTRADVPVIFSSGYDEDSLSNYFDKKPGVVDFIHKPYSLGKLALKMRRLLEGDDRDDA
jgi:CheY-like chemotaxis protein